MDNRHLSPEQLTILRKKIVEAVIKKGYKQQEAVQMFGISATTVSKYIREYKQYGEESLIYKIRGLPKRHGVKISISIEESLKQTLINHTPDEVGLECVLWTRDTVKEYLKRTYGIEYSRWTIGRLLKRLGFSPQKPMKRAFERDPVKVKQWLKEEYPKIKRRATEEKANIFWGDEMGIQSDDQRGRTYGKIGQTPVIRKTGKRFRCNMIAAITNYGTMKWMVFADTFNVDKFLVFLKRLIFKAQNKIFLIIDNLRVHHAKKVCQWLEKVKDKIELFFIPPYCPELNPQELVNQDVKANAGQFRVMKSMDDLQINIRYYLTKIQCNPFKIISFFQKKEVQYAS
jgi:transposase